MIHFTTMLTITVCKHTSFSLYLSISIFRQQFAARNLGSALLLFVVLRVLKQSLLVYKCTVNFATATSSHLIMLRFNATVLESAKVRLLEANYLHPSLFRCYAT